MAATGAPSLANAAINIGSVRDTARADLRTALDSVRGKKALVLDAKLSGPLGLVAEVALLREHGVENIYHLQPGHLETDATNIVYLVRPKISLMKVIANQVHSHERAAGSAASKGKKNYWVLFVPRRTMICERVLEEEGVLGDVTLAELDLDVFPFEDDVLSLELADAFRECYLDGDRSSLYYVARSLMKLQRHCGVIPRISGKGRCAAAVLQMVTRMRKELGGPEEVSSVAPEIDNLVLIDREVDMWTPMLTQLTYEGIVDEMLGIHSTFVEIPAAWVGAKTGDKAKYPLNSNDVLYNDIRDMSFGALGPYINQRAKYINENYKERHNLDTIGDIKGFMKKLGPLQREHHALGVHTNIASSILKTTRDAFFSRQLETEHSIAGGDDLCNDYIEECIGRQQPVMKVLRLLCLQSLCNNGIKTKQYDFWRREVLQTYGYEYLFTLNNLEKLGLFKRQDGRGPSFSTLRKAFKLIVDEPEDHSVKDVSYVFSGFAPLSIRLIQEATRRGSWRSLEDVTKALPGPCFDEKQPLPAGVATQAASKQRSVTMVYFIGGVTYAEIAALRYLAKQGDGTRDYVVASTKLVNGSSLLTSVMEKL